MQRFHQLMFAVSLVTLSWYGMMVVHELGHVLGAVASGGSVKRVVLHPLAISRTDVSPNPHPAVVVWFGPVVGCLLPLVVFMVVPQRRPVLRNVARFFAGFCLIANGSYISVGYLDRVGDAGEMLRTGTPAWGLLTFGATAMPLGLYLWHGLGSFKRFFSDLSPIAPRMAYLVFAALLATVAAGFVCSPG